MLEVKTKRNYPYYLQIIFVDFDNAIHIIDDNMIIERLSKMEGHKKIVDMFPTMKTKLLNKCSNQDQIMEVEEWFNQDLEALLMPLSYYTITK